jgi:ATP-binding cassette subfamily B protein
VCFISQVSLDSNKTDNELSKLQLEIRKIPDSHFKWIIQQIFYKPFATIVVMIGTIISIGINMTRPYLTGRLFDRMWTLYEGEPTTLVYMLFNRFMVDYQIILFIFLILIAGIVSFVINLLIGILNEYVANMTERRIRDKFYSSVQSKSMAFHDTAKVGELMSQATFDVRIINMTVSPGLRMITSAIISSIIAIVLITYYDWRATMFVLAFLPFYIWTAISYSRKISPRTEQVQKQFGICNSQLQENVSGIRVVRAFTGEKYEIKKFQKKVDKLRDDIIDRGEHQARYFPPLLLTLTITFVLGFSVYQIIQGNMSGGEAITINLALIMLYEPTYQISWVLFLTQMGLAGARRILGTMKEESIIIEKPDAINIGELEGRIEYKNVSFSYQNLSKKTVPSESESQNEEEDSIKEIRKTLEDITFTVDSGDIVAILGPTGCGKSTITKLLARMYNVDSGEILIDGHNIQDVTLDSLRKNIGVIEQDIFLFSTTIKENIAYGLDREVSDEEIIEYAKAAEAHEFIMTFEKGYDTLIGERGVTLSGGQKQRIAIARAFLANPKILILDDSSSAIDAQTEEKIQIAMDKLLENRTVFIITHRLATIKRANKIMVLRKGKIVAQGHHDQLLKNSEDYRRVFGRHLELPPVEAETTGGVAGGSK